MRDLVLCAAQIVRAREDGRRTGTKGYKRPASGLIRR